MDNEESIKQADELLVSSNIFSFDGFEGMTAFLALDRESKVEIVSELADRAERHFESAISSGIIRA